MSAFDTAKEIIRIGSTAGLSKDVVDLLEKKATLLAEENLALARKLDEAITKISSLESDIAQLRQQLEQSQPSGFVISEGLFWKRRSSGDFEPRPYCPECPTPRSCRQSHPRRTP